MTHRNKTATELAELDAKEINLFLLEKFQGQTIKKNAIAVKFNLPINRAVRVFTILSQYGFEVERTTITVPKQASSSEQD